MIMREEGENGTTKAFSDARMSEAKAAYDCIQGVAHDIGYQWSPVSCTRYRFEKGLCKTSE